MSKQGVIYILTNPSFPQYVKIGYADNVDSRLKQLNNSECIPFAFRIYATYEVEERLTDLKLHALIDQLNPSLRSIDNVDGKSEFVSSMLCRPNSAKHIRKTIKPLCAHMVLVQTQYRIRMCRRAYEDVSKTGRWLI